MAGTQVNPAYEPAAEAASLTPRIASAFSQPSAPGSYAAGANGAGVNEAMVLLIDRIDRMTNTMQRHTTGHYIRGYGALDIANPAPLGFMAFSLATCLYMTQQAGLTEASTQFISFSVGMFFGGATMLVVAVLEIFRRNTLGATAFGTFGSFWISVGVYGVIRTSGVFFLDSPKGLEALTALFGVAAVGFMVVSIAINLALPLVFFMIAMMFFLLSAGTTRENVGKAAGWWGIFTSALAFYIGLAMLFEDMWGKEVLPLFYTKIYKKHAKMLFPRVSEHDPLSLTAGVPYPGRPELRAGDNLSALAITPSLATMPRGHSSKAGGDKRPAEMVSTTAMETTGGLTKRLAFDELGAVDLAGPEPEALIQALRHPTVEGFSRALELLQGTARARFAAVQETAVEASDAVGEADLRRLKRQFSSLKNTFLHFEVKNEFLAELLDGRPHGDEGELLQHFEAEVEASVAHLRQLKAANEEAQGAITQVVGQIAAAHDAFERQRAALTGELARLAAEVGAHEAGAEAHATALPELPEGPGEAECHDALAASAAEARQLEAAIAAAQAEAEELGAAIAAEREEAEALRAQLGDLEGQNAAAGERVESNARFLSTAQWCDEVAGTITQLGGLSLLHVQPDALHLKLVTAYPTAAVRGADPGPCATADHELSLQLLPGAGNTVYGVTLEPADVEVADIAEAAREGRRPADFVVREVTARLGALLHRRALVEEAAAQFDLASSSTDAGIVRARLGSGVEAEARLVGGWPAGPDVVHITQVSGAADAVKAAKAEALRFEGRGLLAALEAVQRELA